MNPEEPKQEQVPVEPVETVQADVYNEPASAPDVPQKKSSKGVFVALVVVIIVLLGASGYFIWQTIDNLNKGATQQQTGGDLPNINGEQEPVTNRPADQ